MAAMLGLVPPQVLDLPDAAEVHRRLDRVAADFPLLAGLMTEVRRSVDKRTEPFMRWRFVMLGPVENRLVVEWITDHSKRPKVAVRLWAAIMCRMAQDTGEVLMDRQEMADASRAGRLSEVSAVLGELRSCGALIRDKRGQVVRWFVNPRVATHLVGLARSMVQRNAPDVAPMLSVLEGGVPEPDALR